MMKRPPMPIKHVQQQSIGFCLPACAQMALSQFGIHISQRQIAQALGTISGLGTPFSSITRLERWNVQVELVSWQGIASVMAALQQGQAVVAAILTSIDLPGWSDLRTQHTVLVIAVDDQRVTYHDPALATGPTQVSVDSFWLTWSEMSEKAALIR